MSFAAELETLIRARYPIIYLVTSEEARLQAVVVEEEPVLETAVATSE